MLLSADAVARSLITSRERDAPPVAILKLPSANVRFVICYSRRRLGKEGDQKEDYWNWKNETSKDRSEKAEERLQRVHSAKACQATRQGKEQA